MSDQDEKQILKQLIIKLFWSPQCFANVLNYLYRMSRENTHNQKLHTTFNNQILQVFLLLFYWALHWKIGKKVLLSNKRTFCFFFKLPMLIVVDKYSVNYTDCEMSHFQTQKRRNFVDKKSHNFTRSCRLGRAYMG